MGEQQGKREQETEEGSSASQGQEREVRWCRACGEQIQATWRACPHCGEAVKDAAATPSREESGGARPELVSGVLAGVGGLLMVVGSFLPWLSVRAAFVGQVERSGMEGGDGVFTLIIGLGLVALGVTRALSSADRKFQRWAIVLAGIGGLITAANVADVQSRVSEATTTGEGFVAASIGAGLWTLGVGVLLALIAGFVTKPMRVA